MNEADTCRKFVVPGLQAAGWETDPDSTASPVPGTEEEVDIRGELNNCRILTTEITEGAERAREEVQKPGEPLVERGIDFATLAGQAGRPEADLFDLLCQLAFNAPVLTQRQRTDRVKKQQAAFFDYLGVEAREILGALLEKYASGGEVRFTLPDVLKVPPISQRGNVDEIVGKFGGADELRSAVGQMQSMLYAQ